MPLNTFNSNIEYGFYSLPLRNSAITIRIWFNKSVANLQHTDSLPVLSNV